MPRRLTFNKRSLAALEPPPEARVYVYDANTPNLALCVTAAGGKTFYRYGKVDGKPERIVLGKFPDMTVEQARRACRDISGKLACGDHPDERPKRGGLTLDKLFALYLDGYAKLHKRTWQHDAYQFDKYLSEWRDRKLEHIRRLDVERFHASVGERIGRTTANRVRALLSKMFAYAIEHDLCGLNPCVGVRKFREQSRDRFLQADELPRLFAALADEPNQTFADYVRISVFVGARRGNTLAMRWEEIDLDRREWRIPMTKAGQPQLLPLPAAAVEILRRRHKQAKGPWVFPGRGKSGHLESPRKTWLRLLERAGIAHATLHDLRRTLGSWQAAAGTSELIIGKSLGHAPGSKATAVYARLNLDPVRQSVETATAAMLAAGQPPKPTRRKGRRT